MPTHRFDTVIRLPHTDAAGVVFFARVFDLAHLAFEDFLDVLGHPLVPALHSAAVGYPLVHAEADYARPLCMGDRLRIDVAVAEVRARSFQLTYDLSVADEARARVQTVHAALDVAQRSRVALADDLRAKLESYRS